MTTAPQYHPATRQRNTRHGAPHQVLLGTACENAATPISASGPLLLSICVTSWPSCQTVTRPENVAQLEYALLEEWKNIPHNRLWSFVGSMRSRCDVVITIVVTNANIYILLHQVNFNRPKFCTNLYLN